MASAQDLRKRIKSVSNTQQITKAMKMVASARIRKAQSRAEGVEPYADKLAYIMHQLSSAMDTSISPLLEVRPVKRTAYIIVGADKGLAGAFSSNLVKFVEAIFAQEEVSPLIIASGRKVVEHFSRRGYSLGDSYSGYSDKPEYIHAKRLVQVASEAFVSGQVDEVVLVYTKFVNSMTQVPVQSRLLPVTLSEDMASSEHRMYYYMPGETELIQALLPQYLNSMVYSALLQSAASELGARMTAMTSATDNAGDLIEQLSLEYNKLRQANITNEISEIVGGANALQ